jgi:hypothetical protein
MPMRSLRIEEKLLCTLPSFSALSLGIKVKVTATSNGIASAPNQADSMSNLVIEHLDEFVKGVCATSGTGADYIFGTPSAPAYN